MQESFTHLFIIHSVAIRINVMEEIDEGSAFRYVNIEWEIESLKEEIKRLKSRFDYFEDDLRLINQKLDQLTNLEQEIKKLEK